MESIKNPWKNAGHVKTIAIIDGIIGILCIIRRASDFLHNPSPYTEFFNDCMREKRINETLEKGGNVSGVIQSLQDGVVGVIPVYLYRFGLILVYTWQTVMAVVLYTAVNSEAVQKDPHVSLARCKFWLRTSRGLLTLIVIKLCLQPFVVWLSQTAEVPKIVLAIVELIFRASALCRIEVFVSDLE